MNWQSVVSIVLAARIWKNIPLLYLFLSGFALHNNGQNYAMLFVSLWVIVFASVFMTHLNILTDKELDAQTKPELYALLSLDKNFTAYTLAIELILCIAGLLFMVFSGFIYPAACLALFTVVAILYSYNFLTPRNPIKNRLKLFWWGHFGVMIIGYMCLWVGGLLCGVDNSLPFNPRLWYWLPLFFWVSVSEYSLFLLESSIDTRAEQKMGLKTAVAVLGEKRTALAAVFICFAALCIFILTMYFSSAGYRKWSILWAFAPGIFARLVTELIILALRSSRINYLWKLKAPDIIFNGTRLYTLIAILLLKR